MKLLPYIFLDGAPTPHEGIIIYHHAAEPEYNYHITLQWTYIILSYHTSYQHTFFATIFCIFFADDVTKMALKVNK